VVGSEVRAETLFVTSSAGELPCSGWWNRFARSSSKSGKEITMMTKLAVLTLTFAMGLSGTTCGSPREGGARVPAGGAAGVAEARVDAEAIGSVAAELAGRAEAGDGAYVAKRMGNGAGAEAAADMIARIRRADVGKTFRAHLEGRGMDSAGLNYHEPSHFQVELRKGAEGKWEVGRLWVCR
jgi:hypothetical protein